MTNVVEGIAWRSRAEAQPSADELLKWLLALLDEAERAEKRVSGARSLPKLLEYYARWLRSYYELQSGLAGSFVHLQKIVKTDADQGKIEQIADHMANVQLKVKGPHPWLSVPNLKRTQHNAYSVICQSRSELALAIAVCRILAGRTQRGPRHEQ